MTDDEFDQVETHIQVLQDKDAESSIAATLSKLLEHATLAESVCTTLSSLNRLGEDNSVDYAEDAIDALNNELTACVIFLAGLEVDVSSVLRNMGAAYKRHGQDPKLASALELAFKSVAESVDRVKSVREAKQNNNLQKTT